MEAFLQGLGAVSAVILIALGAAIGALAGWLMGRRVLVYAVFGSAGALALPFVLAALGIGVLAAGGLLLLAAVAIAGALIAVLIVRALRK